MATAGQVITDALQELNVQADEQSIQSTDMQAGIRYLNRMMFEWDATGLPLGFTMITNPADIVTVPDGALSGIIANLATRLSSQFDVAIPIELAASAKSGMEAIEFIAVTVNPVPKPDTLSIGSGNESYPYVDHFYNEEIDNDILT